MAKKKQLRANTDFFAGSPEERLVVEEGGDAGGARYVAVGELVDVDDPVVEGREEYFDPA